MRHAMMLVLVFVALSFGFAASASAQIDRCYTSYNTRGESFWLEISIDRNGHATRIRYNGKASSIPLSYYGRESVHFRQYGERHSVRTYVETYKGKVTGKLYFLDEPLSSGIDVVFERMKDGQFFYFEECDL